MLLSKNIRGDPASVMGNRYVKPIDGRKKQFGDNSSLHGTSICQNLPSRNYDETEVTERNKDEKLKRNIFKH